MSKIDKTKEYRYRNRHYATLLTTWRPGSSRWLVISVDDFGNVHYHDENGLSKVSSSLDLIQVSQWDHIEEGDVVEVRDDDSEPWKLRRFSKISAEGLPLTLHESGVALTQWKKCRLVCAQENEEWKLV